MIPGLAFFESGMLRRKNSVSIITQTLGGLVVRNPFAAVSHPWRDIDFRLQPVAATCVPLGGRRIHAHVRARRWWRDRWSTPPPGPQPSLSLLPSDRGPVRASLVANREACEV